MAAPPDATPVSLLTVLGLESMADRVRLAGGVIETRATPGANATVAFSLPVGRR